jgi:hypothetical protein
MVTNNGEVDNQNEPEDDSDHEDVLVNTEDEKPQRRQDVLHGKKRDIPIPDQEVHERVDLPGTVLQVNDRKVGIQNGEKNDKEQGKEEVRVIEIDVKVGSPIRPPPNGSPTPRKNMTAQRCRWLLPPVRDDSPVFFQWTHLSTPGAF